MRMLNTVSEYLCLRVFGINEAIATENLYLFETY